MRTTAAPPTYRVELSDQRRGVLDAEIVHHLLVTPTHPTLAALVSRYSDLGWRQTEIEGALDTLWQTGRVKVIKAVGWQDNPETRQHMLVLQVVL